MNTSRSDDKKRLIVATRNPGKLREIRSLLDGSRWDVLGLDDLDQNLPPIEEDGATFEENAIKKAITVSACFPEDYVLGEDSGLEVDALGGAPGVRSARYAGEKASDGENNIKLLQALEGIPFDQRRARYHCAMALARRGRVVELVHETCEGMITWGPRGTHGFGYDPLFYLPAYQRTFGELPDEVKAAISHRAKAVKRMARRLNALAIGCSC